MSSMVEFKVDSKNAMEMLRRAPYGIRTELRKELTLIAKETVTAARTKMPSGMKSGKTGFRWAYWGTKGAVMEAMGSDKAHSPKSWAGAVEGGPTGQKGWRHPVYPKAGSPRKSWHWGPKKSSQAAIHPLHDEWLAREVTIIGRSEEAVRVALERSGLGVD